MLRRRHSAGHDLTTPRILQGFVPRSLQPAASSIATASAPATASASASALAAASASADAAPAVAKV